MYVTFTPFPWKVYRLLRKMLVIEWLFPFICIVVSLLSTPVTSNWREEHQPSYINIAKH